MALDPRYISSDVLQQVFRDKDTGEPLRGGKVYFRVDTSRNTPKTVYKLTGSPPNYTYVPVAVDPNNAVLLNDVGAFDDTIYFFPFDNDQKTELYFVEVYSVDNAFQFSREGMPNFTTEDVSDTREYNYVDNGQFLIHTDIQPDGTATGTSVNFAPDWYFHRNDNGSTDVLTFPETPSFQTPPPPHQPRYALRLQTTAPAGGDTIKDIAKRYSNVNRFASDTQKYTFGFYAKSNSANIDGNLVLNRNYGTGGAPYESTDIINTDFTLTSDFQKFSFSFIPGTTQGKVVGSENDDWLEIAIRTNPGSSRDIEITDVFLFEGEKLDDEFPLTTDVESKSLSMGGTIETPNPDGSEIGLPIVWEQGGFTFDDSVVGTISAYVGDTPPKNYAICDGSFFKTSDYSSDGIPYSRLFNKLFDGSFGYPRFGTRPEFFISRAITINKFMVSNTTPGIVSDSADSSTGITITRIGTGNTAAAMTCAFAGTFSGFVSAERTVVGETQAGFPSWQMIGTPAVGTSLDPIYPGNSSVKEYTRIEMFSAAGVSGGDVIQSRGVVPGDDFYVWFKKDGAGINPGGSGTAYECDIQTGDSSGTVAIKTAAVMGGRAASLLDFSTLNTLSGSEYFVMVAAKVSGTQLWTVWYEVDGSGTQPSVPNSEFIKVSILSTDDTNTVGIKTLDAINSQYFRVPDLRGAFIRGKSGSSGKDLNVTNRYNENAFLFGADQIGTNQHFEIPAHKHGIDLYPNLPNDINAIRDFTTDDSSANKQDTNNFGEKEVAPYNVSLNYIIHL